jgi:sugar phosphate isomerase/epimerase
VPTGYGFWCNAWPRDPAWRFVAVGVGHDVPYWTGFLRALAEVNPDMAVNIEHEDASYSRLDGLALAAGTSAPPQPRCDGPADGTALPYRRPRI